MAPTLDPVQDREGEVGRGFALSTHQFTAAAHVIHHPRRQGKVVGVAGDFTDMEGNGGDHVGDVGFAQLQHEIGVVHLAPELGFHEVAGESGGQRRQGVHDEQVGADVSGIPIALVGEDDDARGGFLEDVRDDGHGAAPVFGVLTAGFGVYFFEAGGSRGGEFETEELAGSLEFVPARHLAFFFAALGDGDVDDPHAGFAQEAEGDPARDALIIRVRGEEEGGVGRFGGRGVGLECAGLEGAGGGDGGLQVANVVEVRIGVHLGGGSGF